MHDYLLDERNGDHMYLNGCTHTQLSFSMCSSFLSSSLCFVCVCVSVCVGISVCLCVSERCTCISASKPHLQFTAASLAHCPNLCLLTLLFFLFSSVHCFGLQLLYLFRLTGGLALPLGFRMGSGIAEKGGDNRNRQGLDHPRYSPPKYYFTTYPSSNKTKNK